MIIIMRPRTNRQFGWAWCEIFGLILGLLGSPWVTLPDSLVSWLVKSIYIHIHMVLALYPPAPSQKKQPHERSTIQKLPFVLRWLTLPWFWPRHRTTLGPTMHAALQQCCPTSHRVTITIVIREKYRGRCLETCCHNDPRNDPYLQWS